VRNLGTFTTFTRNGRYHGFLRQTGREIGAQPRRDEMLTAQTWPPDEVNGNLTLHARNKTDTSTSAFAHYGHYSRSLMLMYARLAAKACISLPILVRLIPSCMTRLMRLPVAQ
jgi:hypothetical protein